MLQRESYSRNLTPVGSSAQLLRQLEALRETRRTERMTFGQETARGVGYYPTAVSVIATKDEWLGCSLGA